jgi:hypothetical protein
MVGGERCLSRASLHDSPRLTIRTAWRERLALSIACQLRVPPRFEERFVLSHLHIDLHRAHGRFSFA